MGSNPIWSTIFNPVILSGLMSGLRIFMDNNMAIATLFATQCRDTRRKVDIYVDSRHHIGDVNEMVFGVIAQLVERLNGIQ